MELIPLIAIALQLMQTAIDRFAPGQQVEDDPALVAAAVKAAKAAAGTRPDFEKFITPEGGQQ